MKATVISIFLLILIPLASSLDFTLDSPDSADLNESFSVNIVATTSDIYDVKIFVQDNSTKAIISEIYNEGWKNPYYYVKSIFPEKSEFELRITLYSDNAALCARLRKTNSSSYGEECNAISINQDSQAEEKTDEDEEAIPATNKSLPQSEDFVPANEETKTPVEIPEDRNQDKIILTPKKEEVFVSNQEKVKLYAVYAFTLFALIIIILLSLRKL